jgi:hypothetical protein
MAVIRNLTKYFPAEGRLEKGPMPSNIIIMAPGNEIGYNFNLRLKAWLSQFAALPGGFPCLGPDYRSKE